MTPVPTGHLRLLALDGGGIRGAFTAAVLARLEESTGCAVADHFDLIAGTSTGGILALGLGLGLPARDLRDFYRHRGPRIFRDNRTVARLWAHLRHLWATKISRAALERELRAVFGDRKLGESRCRLVLPTYDAVRGRIFLLKTAHHPNFVHDIGASAVDCALATAAAPTYFQAAPFPAHQGASYIDGGVWANCPAMVAVAEAIAFLGARAGEIDLLSIGTTSEPFHISRRRRLGGLLIWNKGLVKILMRGQEEAAQRQARLLVGPESYCRIDCEVAPKRFSLDGARQVADLIALGDGKAKEKEVVEAVRRRFLNGEKAMPFEPVRRLDLDTSGRAAEPALGR